MSEPEAVGSIRTAVRAVRTTDAQADTDESAATARFATAQQESEASFAHSIAGAQERRSAAETEANRQRDAARIVASSAQDEANQLTLRTLHSADLAMSQTHSRLSYVKGVSGVQPNPPPQPDSAITGGGPSRLLAASEQRATALAASILQAIEELEQARTRRGKMLRLGLVVVVGILFAVLLFVIAGGLHH